MNSAKRLLLVVTQSEWGGVQSYVLRCAKEAQRRGFAVLVAAGGTQELATRCRNNQVPYQELHYMTRAISPLQDLRAMQELRTLYASWNPSTIYLHSSKAGVIGSIAARGTNACVIYRIGGWSFLDPVSPLQQMIRRWSERLTAARKDIIITVHPGDEILANRASIRPRQQLITIPNGLDLAVFDAALLPRHNARAALDPHATDDVPMLLTVANLYPTKNILGYLDAIALLKQQGTRVRVIVIGDGEERASIEAKQRALGLTEDVLLLGQQRDASTLLRGADLFVLPSVKEGMPWTLLEAMAAGIPCVATDVGANRWMLGDAGWIVPARDPRALATAIHTALTHGSAMEQCGRTARQIVATRFTQTSMWEATFARIR
jgi:glycosyltransferase involved in cell wall biosynthesis